MRANQWVLLSALAGLIPGCSSTETCDDDGLSSSAACPPTVMDEDGDGVAAEFDCDDMDSALLDILSDPDCDGYLEIDDCDNEDPDSTTREQDFDCDGYRTEDDCDDEDPDIYPGAEEDWSDGVDQDCDGNADSICGDGLLGNIEECDDGGMSDGDGCSSTCLIEPWCSGGCTSDADCSDPDVCIGIPSEVPMATGRCQDPRETHPGAESACSPTEPCGENLVCSGEYRWGAGSCAPEWLAKTFHRHDPQDIPDDASLLRSPVIACALATVPVDVLVTLHLDHPRPEDLVVRLEDPQGEQGVVLDHEMWSPGQISVRVGSGDDAVNGEWTLELADTVPGQQGRLLGWSVYLVSRFD